MVLISYLLNDRCYFCDDTRKMNCKVSTINICWIVSVTEMSNQDVACCLFNRSWSSNASPLFYSQSHNFLSSTFIVFIYFAMPINVSVVFYDTYDLWILFHYFICIFPNHPTYPLIFNRNSFFHLRHAFPSICIFENANAEFNVFL